jgi:hypothetical protein
MTQISRRMSVRDSDHAHAGRQSSRHSRLGILDDPAIAGLHAKKFGCPEKNVWLRFSAPDLCGSQGNREKSSQISHGEHRLDYQPLRA